MSRLQFRSSIAGAAVLVALLASSPAHAQAQIQNGYDPGPPRESGTLVNRLATGVQYDIVNQAVAERQLEKTQAKLRRDAERCNQAAVERDARRIHNLKYRIVVDEWLIRKNSLCDPGPYPHSIRLDPITCAALANAARPAPPNPPQIPPY